MGDWWNPTDWPEMAGEAVGDVWGAVSGGTRAANAQRQAGQLSYDAAIRGQNLQRDMFNQSQGFQREMYDRSRADLAPFRGLGLSALQDYYRRAQAGGDDADLKRYQQEQTDAFNMQMSKRGLLGSSASTKGLSDLGAKIAEAREQRYYERMSPLLGIGSGVSGQLANSAMGYGGQFANSALAFGRGQSDLGMAAAGALGGGLTGAANTDAQSRMGLLNTGLMAASLYGMYGAGSGAAAGGTTVGQAANTGWWAGAPGG